MAVAKDKGVIHGAFDPPPEPETILSEAERLVGEGGDRNDAYDHPLPNHQNIATIWSVILGVKVSPRKVALCLIGLKLAREAFKPRRDNWVDIAGYSRCIERMFERGTPDEVG